MRKSFFVLASLTLVMFLVVTKSPAQVRLQDAEDRISRTPQWSLFPTWQLSDFPNPNYRIHSEIPAIGIFRKIIFGGGYYYFRKKLIIINMNENALEVAPRNLRQSITPGITQFQNIAEVLFTRDNKCYVTAVITGKFRGKQYPMLDTEMNISFHGFLTKLHSGNINNFEYFEYIMPVGLFVPKGVISASQNNIHVEKFEAQHITLAKDRYIPCIFKCINDNSKFKTSLLISSFWTLAKVGEHGNNIIVTYHLLLNSEELSDAVEHIINNATETRHYIKMLDEIRNVAGELKVDEFSAGILRDWVDNVKHISRPFESSATSQISEVSIPNGDDDNKDDH